MANQLPRDPKLLRVDFNAVAPCISIAIAGGGLGNYP